MEYSFKAKLAFENEDFKDAQFLYKKAAELEGSAAKFYFDKPQYEPTRSILIRSAAFMFLKAGLIQDAKEFIYQGLVSIKDEIIINQLEDALDSVRSLKHLDEFNASKEYNYRQILKLKSIDYILEPSDEVFGQNTVSLEMVHLFAGDYLKSVNSYALANAKKLIDDTEENETKIKKYIKEISNPLIPDVKYGSFKISLANDYLYRGESDELLNFKKNLLFEYHKKIFINSLDDLEIEKVKKEYNEEQVDSIFRPLTKIRAINSPYKVSYFDKGKYKFVYPQKIVNNQRKKLLITNKLNSQEIGSLENSIFHLKHNKDGKISKKTIKTTELKQYQFEERLSLVKKGSSQIFFNEDIVIDINFNSDSGFKFSFPDLKIELGDFIDFNKGLEEFNVIIHDKIVELAKLDEKDPDQLKYWKQIKTFVNNINELKRK